MQTDLQIFSNEEFGKIRAIEIDGAPWFIGKDVSDALGYQNPRKALNDHVDDEDKNTVTIRDGIPGNPNRTIINESGLYSLILSSKLPDAKKFKRWVTSDVLPSIRKHGAYVMDELLKAAEESVDIAVGLFGELIEEKAKNDALTDKVDALAPKAAYCDVILQSKNAVPVSLIAKDYGMSAAAFNRLLHGLRIQYKVGGAWVPYQQYAGKGYTKSRTYVVNETTSAIHTYWTQRGRLFLYDTLKACGILPLMEAGQRSFAS